MKVTMNSRVTSHMPLDTALRSLWRTQTLCPASFSQTTARGFHAHRRLLHKRNISSVPSSTQLPRISLATSSYEVKRSYATADASQGWHEMKISINNTEWPFSSIFLRDSCTCNHCVDESSKQKSFLTNDIPGNIEGQLIASEAGKVSIRWNNDIAGFSKDHVTTLGLEDLERLVGHEVSALDIPWAEWSAADFSGECTDIPYDEYMTSDKALFKAFKQMRKYGLLFVSNVPESAESVAKIAQRIGPIKNTLYGEVWDVRSVPEATNVAYTSKDLGFHMDLLPMALVPHFQFLHCIRSSAKGGNSLFTDVYKAAYDLWREDQDAFWTLATVPVTFHYDHPETHIYKQGVPVIVVDGKVSAQADVQPVINAINWSPPFQGPFTPSIIGTGEAFAGLQAFNKTIAAWRKAAARFNQLIHREENIYERLMRPGECVVFMNTRVLHARTAFDVDDAGKERWLRGCYVDRDVVRSKERVVENKLKHER